MSIGYILLMQKGRWYVYKDRVNLEPEGFPSAAIARQWCWKTNGTLPELLVQQAAPFNPMYPFHAALERLEARHNERNTITMVDTKEYWIKRSKFAMDTKVAYRVKDGIVYARNDSEPFAEG